jgi:protein-L-isoaspartate(D-aspartate) O-methyltransferase
MAELAYLDLDLPVLAGDAQAPARRLLKPMVLAKLIQAAAVGPTDHVLDVGCATGYSSAVFARMAARVVALEQDSEFADAAARNLRELINVAPVKGPFVQGCPDRGPFNVIFLNGAVEKRPAALLDQLADDGRLVCIMRDGAAAHGYLYVKHDGAIGERSAFDAQLPVLPGFEKSLSFSL